MHKFDRLMDKMKKKGKELDPLEKEAKMSVVKAMREAASEEMTDKLGKLKKVTVASDSKEGLQAGLDKAKEMMEKMPEGMEQSSEESEEASEEEQEECPKSVEEIDAKIKELLALKEKMGK